MTWEEYESKVASYLEGADKDYAIPLAWWGFETWAWEYKAIEADLLNSIDPGNRYQLQLEFLQFVENANELEWMTALNHGLAKLRTEEAESDPALDEDFQDMNTSYQNAADLNRQAANDYRTAGNAWTIATIVVVLAFMSGT